MSLEESKSAFTSILSSLDADRRQQFLSWVKSQWYTDSCASKAYFDLRTIAQDIKTMVPLSAILDSEKIVKPPYLSGSGDGSQPVLHVDSFLFDEEDVDALVETGQLSRNFCQNCGSTKVTPITFISHSISIERILFIFQHLLPDLTGKVLLDIGSRLGAVLYGAYHCSQASRIIGVEFNEDLCKLQNLVLKKYGMTDRIEVICKDVCQVPDVVRSADVIILTNVFESFLPEDSQVQTWVWLRNTIVKQGTVLVTTPSLEESLSLLQTGIDLSSWVKEIPIEDEVVRLKIDDHDLLSGIHLYSVL